MTEDARARYDKAVWQVLREHHIDQHRNIPAIDRMVASLGRAADVYALDVAAGQVGRALAEVPQPPREASLGEPGCDAWDGDWACTAQRHHAPPHLAHGDGSIMHAWGTT